MDDLVLKPKDLDINKYEVTKFEAFVAGAYPSLSDESVETLRNILKLGGVVATNLENNASIDNPRGGSLSFWNTGDIRMRITIYRSCCFNPKAATPRYISAAGSSDIIVYGTFIYSKEIMNKLAKEDKAKGLPSVNCSFLVVEVHPHDLISNALQRQSAYVVVVQNQFEYRTDDPSILNDLPKNRNTMKNNAYRLHNALSKYGDEYNCISSEDNSSGCFGGGPRGNIDYTDLCLEYAFEDMNTAMKFLSESVPYVIKHRLGHSICKGVVDLKKERMI